MVAKIPCSGLLPPSDFPPRRPEAKRRNKTQKPQLLVRLAVETWETTCLPCNLNWPNFSLEEQGVWDTGNPSCFRLWNHHYSKHLSSKWQALHISYLLHKQEWGFMCDFYHFMYQCSVFIDHATKRSISSRFLALGLCLDWACVLKSALISLWLRSL